MIRGGNLLHFLKKSEHSTHLFHLSNVQNSLCMHSSIAESFITQIRTSGVKVMWAFIGRNKNRVIAVQRENGSVWGFGCISVNRWMGAVRLAHPGPSRLLCITINLCLCNFAPETLYLRVLSVYVRISSQNWKILTKVGNEKIVQHPWAFTSHTYPDCRYSLSFSVVDVLLSVIC